MTDPFANASCIGVDPEIFFPGEWRAPSAADEALAICGGCPVRKACLDQAMRDEKNATSRHGIYGGTTPQQRIMLAAGTSQRRICERCNTSKPLDAFRPGRRVCAECTREQAREYGRTTYRNRKGTAA